MSDCKLWHRFLEGHGENLCFDCLKDENAALSEKLQAADRETARQKHVHLNELETALDRLSEGITNKVPYPFLEIRAAGLRDRVKRLRLAMDEKKEETTV